MKLSNLPLSRKLLFAFAAVLLAIAAMGATVFLNLRSLAAVGETRSATNQIVRDTAMAEFKLARQENALRGFMLSIDDYYVERVNGHRADFKTALASIRENGDPAMDAQIDVIEAAADEWYSQIAEPGIAMARDPATRTQAIAMIGPDGPADSLMGTVEEALETLKVAEMAALEAARQGQESASNTALIALFAGLAAALLIAVGPGWVLSRGIGGPIANMIGYMRRLIGGDTTFEVPCVTRKDEFGEMGRAVIAFRDAAIEKSRLEAETEEQRPAVEAERARNQAAADAAARDQATVVNALAEGLDHLTRGDLTYTLTQTFPGEYVKLQSDFNAAIGQLKDAMSVVVTNVSAIRSGSGEISQAADDLSRRTEQQAASLEETAAALDQITATVNRTASGAKQASETVRSAKGDAETSGVVVRDAITAMGAIETSAHQINQTIGVIDEMMPRWVTGEKPRMPPTGKPMKATA